MRSMMKGPPKLDGGVLVEMHQFDGVTCPYCQNAMAILVGVNAGPREVGDVHLVLAPNSTPNMTSDELKQRLIDKNIAKPVS